MPTENEAVNLARANADEEISIEKTYWFPNDQELRLVHIDPTTLPSDGILRPFSFKPDPAEGVPHQSQIALITPDEDGNIQLPDNWGTWATAVVVYCRSRAA